MNVTNEVKKIFLVLSLATVVDTSVAMQGPAAELDAPVGAAQANPDLEPQEVLNTCKWKTSPETFCDQTFEQEQKFYDHVAEHRKLTKKDSHGKFHCGWQDCTKDFAQKKSLTHHIRAHTGEKLFTCDHPGCDYRVAWKTNLNKHKKIHTGDKLFKCNHPGCAYSSVRMDSLTRHMRKHTGEKPYKCDYPGCTYEASHQNSLKIHKSKHPSEKPNPLENARLDHQIADPSQNLQCEFCKMYFHDGDELFWHKIDEHPLSSLGLPSEEESR